MNIMITGVSRGLGLSMLHDAVKRGYHVYGTVRDEAAKEKVLAQLSSEELEMVHIYIVEITDESSIQSMAEQLQQEGIVLNVIINNAAVLLGRQTAITDVTLESLKESFEINLFGAMMIVKHFISLTNKEHSKILNISSEAGSITKAYAGDYPYSLSKCAMNLFSEQLRIAYKKHNKDVWSIHPGWMKTDMGGPHAALESTESAKSIINIADGTLKVNSEQSFIDFKGSPMAI